MRTNIFLQQRIPILIVCVSTAIFLPFFYLMFQSPKDVNAILPSLLHRPLVSAEKTKSIVSLPKRLKIPSLAIDTVVEEVGLTADGAQDVPKGESNVGWFDRGPRPGEVGSAVIDGHSGYKDNKPAIFDSLSKLQKGDKVYIQDARGLMITFVVQKLKSYGRTDNTLDVFTSKDGLSHLNLITCAGDWNPVVKTHSNRLVVFTTREI